MSTTIPTSTSVSESAVIEAPMSAVWHLIKLQDFCHFWGALDKSEWVKGTSPETDIVKWTFKDGTVLDVKQEEHSVSLGNWGAILGSWFADKPPRPSSITSRTASSRPSRLSATARWLARCAAFPSRRASTRATRT